MIGKRRWVAGGILLHASSCEADVLACSGDFVPSELPSNVCLALFTMTKQAAHLPCPARKASFLTDLHVLFYFDADDDVYWH